MNEYLKKNKGNLIFIFLATFCFYVLSNGYGIFNFNLSYDSLRELVMDEWTITHRIEISRVIDIFYAIFIRGRITTPMLVYVGGLIWLYLSVVLFIRIFKLENNKLLIILISGILTTNYVVSDLACTNPQQLDVNMLSLFASLLAVYFWKKENGFKGLLFGSLCVFVSYGIYASYVQVSILLIVFILINELIDGEKAKECLLKGLLAVLMIIVGIVINTILIKTVIAFTGVSLSSIRSGADSLLSIKMNEVFELLVDTFLHGVYFFIDAYSVENNRFLIVINIIFVLIAFCLVVERAIKKRIGVMESILLVALLFAIPFGTNVVYFASKGMVKTMLTRYAQILLPSLVLLVIFKYTDFQKLKKPIIILSCIVIMNNIQFDNACYLKKELEDKATLSFLTRVVERIEEDERYIPGESKVIFVGDTKKMLNKIPGFENLYRVNGQEYPISTTGRKKFESYFKYILINPIIIADEKPWDLMQDNKKALDLKIFPNHNSAEIIDGYYVIRLS